MTKKIRIFVDFEKEELWLNKMAGKGLALVKYSFGMYTFEQSQLGEYIYRMQYMEKNIKEAESKEYLDFLAETGAEIVCVFGSWVYLRRKASEGEFVVFSDIDQRIKHYNTIATTYSVLGVCFLPIAIVYMSGNGGIWGRIASIISFAGILLMYLCALKYLRKAQKLEKSKVWRE